MMNRILLTTFLLIILVCTGGNAIAQTQCSGGTPGGTLTAPTVSYQVATYSAAGTYKTFDAQTGTTYNFTFCSNGGSADYDTEITILHDNTGEYAGGYNDQYCGDLSDLTWTAPTSGTFRVLVTDWFACTNTIASALAYKVITQCTGGTPDGSLPTPSLAYQTAIFNGTGKYKTFVAQEGVKYNFTYCSNGGSASFKTEITILDNAGNATEEGNNYNGVRCGLLLSGLTWIAPSSGTYRVLVTEFNCVTNSKVSTLAYNAVAPPANDFCSGAIALAVPSTTMGNTTTATVDNVDVCGTDDGLAGGLWYSVVGNGQVFAASLCGSSFDTKIRVFTGDCGSFACVTGNDDSDFCSINSVQSHVTWCSAPGTTYRILVHGYSFYDGAFSLVLSGTDVPKPDITPSAPSICLGGSVLLTASGLNDYSWTPSAGLNVTNLAAVTASPTSTTTYTVSGIETTTQCYSFKDVTVTLIPIPAQPGTITGNAEVCFGSPNNYSISVVPDATSYTWTLPGGWTGTSTTTSITTVANGPSGTISVKANNVCGSSAVQPLAVIVNTVPTAPGSITGPSAICSGSENDYSITAVPGATSYTWTLPGGWIGTSTSATINTTASTTSGTISVTANNSICSSAAQTLNVLVDVAVPGNITGNTFVCVGSSNTYSISSVPAATSYTWTLPGGWTGTSTTTSINTVASGTSGTILVTANNSCGSSAAQTLNVTVSLTEPAMPCTVIGNTTTCSGSFNTYSIATVPDATSYTWTLPSGWTGTSTTTSITTKASISGGDVSVTANNSCGPSASSPPLSITVNIAPDIPGTISGNAAICSGSSNTYSITTVPGAISYTWILPDGWTGTSTTTSVTTTASTQGGNILVQSNNTLCSSPFQSLSVSVVVAPTTLGSITGNTAPCSASSNTYSVAAANGATSYTWTLPGSWTGTSTTNSISAIPGATGGNISVAANNSCGSSAQQTLAVTVNTVPEMPQAIVGSESICKGSSNTYSIIAVNGATSYGWTFPGGWTGTSKTTDITLKASVNSGNISVVSKNNCGSSTAQTLIVTVGSVPATPETISGNADVCAGSETTYSVLAVTDATSYTWTLPSGWAGVSTTNAISTTATTTDGTISVKANNSCGSSGARTLGVTINAIPVITAQPATIISCIGATKAFVVTASGTSLSYKWKENRGTGFADVTNGGIYSDATTPKLMLTGITSDMNGYLYQCVVSSTCGEETSSSGLLTVAPAKPTITVDATTHPEAPVLIASAGDSYEWFKDGISVGGNLQTLVALEAGAYTVKVKTNGCTSELSDPEIIVITGDLDSHVMSATNVYPNPGSDHVILSLGGFEFGKPVSITIVDLQGRVMQKTIGPGEHEVSIDIRNYATGKYIAWLRQHKTITSRQFIKADQ